jgi:hypothetical protein
MAHFPDTIIVFVDNLNFMSLLEMKGFSILVSFSHSKAIGIVIFITLVSFAKIFEYIYMKKMWLLEMQVVLQAPKRSY